MELLILQTSQSLQLPMETKMSLSKLFSICFLSVLLGLISTSRAFAASGTISVLPAQGSFQNGETFSAQIRIDGGGENFNAAKAKISASPSLLVEGLTLGDCNFAFVDTPSVNSLSFTGVVLGDSRPSCLLYTVNLRVNGSTNGYILITDAAIKAYEGAVELFSKANNSSYTFTGSNQAVIQVSPTQQPLALSGGLNYYTVIYTIPTQEDSLKVVLDPDLNTKITAIPEPYTKNPRIQAATFDNVSEGIHTFAVLSNEKEISNEIVNINGTNREVIFGAATDNAGTNYLTYLIYGIVVLLTLMIIILGYLFYWRKKRAFQ